MFVSVVMVVIALSVSFSESFVSVIVFVIVCGMEAVVEDVPSESEPEFDMMLCYIVSCLYCIVLYCIDRWAYNAMITNNQVK